MSDSDNLFELLTKWSRREEKDPLENRLTAVLVAMASRTPCLRQGLAGLARIGAADGSSANSSIRMHPTAREGNVFRGQPDVELKIDGATIWWEAKLDSPLSGDDQLTKYERCLPPGDRNALVLLAPAEQRRALSSQLGKRTHFVSWEEVLSLVQDCALAATDHERLLLTEGLNFYEMNGLKPTPAGLDTKLVKVLEAQSSAEAALDRTLTAVADRLTHEGYGDPKIMGEERLYDPRFDGRKKRGWGSDAQLAWSYEQVGVRVWAGLYFNPGASHFTKLEARGWLAELSEPPTGWKEEPAGRTGCYIGEYRPLADFVDADGEPHTRIGEWIASVFDHVITTRP